MTEKQDIFAPGKNESGKIHEDILKLFFYIKCQIAVLCTPFENWQVQYLRELLKSQIP